jgi:hypothetical protein
MARVNSSLHCKTSHGIFSILLDVCDPENVKISSEGVWAAIRAVNDPSVNEISKIHFGENVGLFSWGGGGAF